MTSPRCVHERATFKPAAKAPSKVPQRQHHARSAARTAAEEQRPRGTPLRRLRAACLLIFPSALGPISLPRVRGGVRRSAEGGALVCDSTRCSERTFVKLAGRPDYLRLCPILRRPGLLHDDNGFPVRASAVLQSQGPGARKRAPGETRSPLGAQKNALCPGHIVRGNPGEKNAGVASCGAAGPGCLWCSFMFVNGGEGPVTVHKRSVFVRACAPTFAR